MSKVTVMPATVTLVAPMFVAIRPATNSTYVPPAAVTIVGDDQSVSMGPAG